MIIWLNWSFGVWKTTTSEILHKKLENSYIFDPEELGFFIRKFIPNSKDWYSLKNFQDHELWSKWTIDSILYLSKIHENIIVPMNLMDEKNWDYVIWSLKKQQKVFHFSILASENAIFDRMKDREIWVINWCSPYIKQAKILEKEKFWIHIDSEKNNPEQVANLILEKIKTWNH